MLLESSFPWMKLKLDDRERETERGLLVILKDFGKCICINEGTFWQIFLRILRFLKPPSNEFANFLSGELLFWKVGHRNLVKKKKNCGPGFLTTWEGKKMWIFFFYIWISLMILSLHFYGTISWKKNRMKDNSKRTSILKLNKNIFLFSFDQCFVQLLLH